MSAPNTDTQLAESQLHTEAPSASPNLSDSQIYQIVREDHARLESLKPDKHGEEPISTLRDLSSDPTPRFNPASLDKEQITGFKARLQSWMKEIDVTEL